jgi:hypothetical protein
MKPFTVVLDNSPHPPSPWMLQCCEALGLYLVSNDAIADEVSKIEELQPILIGQNQGAEDPRLAPHFLAVLAKLTAGKARVALHSASWLVLGEKPAACILDLDPLEAEKRQAKDRDEATRKQLEEMLDGYKKKVQDIARKHVATERVLVLPAGAADAQKAEQAIAFIRRWDPPAAH